MKDDFLKLFKDLPVHWYHLFVSIRYHKKINFASLNNIQIAQNAIVQNTDLREIRTNAD